MAWLEARVTQPGERPPASLDAMGAEKGYFPVRSACGARPAGL